MYFIVRGIVFAFLYLLTAVYDFAILGLVYGLRYLTGDVVRSSSESDPSPDVTGEDESPQTPNEDDHENEYYSSLEDLSDDEEGYLSSREDLSDDEEGYFSSREDVDDEASFVAQAFHMSSEQEMEGDTSAPTVEDPEPAVDTAAPVAIPSGGAISSDSSSDSEEESFHLLRQNVLSRFEWERLNPQIVTDYLRCLNIVKELGRGAFATVNLLRDRYGRHVVVKSTPLISQEVARKEVNIIRQLSERTQFPSVIAFVVTPHRCNLYYEYFPGQSLGSFLQTHLMSFSEVRYVLYQLGSGLHFMHRESIIHRDVWPENIIINQQLECKIIDFNFADFGPACRGCCGLEGFIAPEVLAHEGSSWRRRKPYSYQADYYSLGITTICMATHLFHIDLLKKILGRKEKKLFPLACVLQEEFNPDGADDTFHDLLYRLLSEDPRKRLGDYDFVSHPFFKRNFQTERVELDPEVVRASVKNWKHHGAAKPTAIRKKFEKRVRKNIHALGIAKVRFRTFMKTMEGKYELPKKKSVWSRMRTAFRRTARSPPRPED